MVKIVKPVALVACWMAAVQLAAATEFGERLAKWNVGPVGQDVRRASFDEPVAGEIVADHPAPIDAAPVVPHAAPSRWHELAYGHGPVHAYAPSGCASCGGGGCGDWHGAAACGQACCSPPMCWCRTEVLLWWRQGRDLPPLVTTDPVSESSDTAGILPNATILYGGERETVPMQAGGRADFGWWLDPSQCWGVGNRFFGLGREDASFRTTSLDNPVLAIPFFDVEQNANDALLVAYPGLRTGSVEVLSSSEVFGNDVYARLLFCRGCYGRIDLLTGYHFSRVNENVEIRSQALVVGGGDTFGTEVEVFDYFGTRNEFHGAILGASFTYDCGGCWSLQGLARTAIGNMHETARLEGGTRFAVPGQATDFSDEGLLVADSNSGVRSRDEFTAISELGLTLGYKVAPCTQITLGYTFMYWNDVLRPGNLIDPAVGTSTAAGTRPQFRFNRSDFWVQGISLGFAKDF
jgi:hypothetical protein